MIPLPSRALGALLAIVTAAMALHSSAEAADPGDEDVQAQRWSRALVCISGNVLSEPTFEALLKEDPTYARLVDQDGETVLHLIVGSGRVGDETALAAIDAALAAGASATAVDHAGRSAIDACLESFDDVTQVRPLVEALLERGVPLAPPVPRTTSTLHRAMGRLGRALGLTELLIGNGAEPNQTDEHGRTALHHAAIENRSEIPALLRLGAKPDARDDGGATALTIVAAAGDVTAVDALLDAGADPRLQDPQGLNAADHGLAAGQEKVVDRLMAAGAGPSLGLADLARLGLIHQQVRARNRDAVGKMLDLRPELVSISDADGRTPLAHATTIGDLDLARLLLDRGADAQSGVIGTWLAGETGPALRELLYARGAVPLHRSHDPRRPARALSVELVRIDGTAAPATADAVHALERELGCRVPAGYERWTTRLGFGLLGIWRIETPARVADEFRDSRARPGLGITPTYWDNAHEAFSPAELTDLVELFSSIDGDRLVFARSNPDRLCVLPRHSSFVFEVGHDLDEAMGRLFADSSDWPPTFKPYSGPPAEERPGDR
ncbi:MAG TPA: ankyrin repeat domain-containing protein [Planctomycetota bacterium]|nr:ankyrin repeat domain-containing protein [Planctomycetota bacterium]